MTTRLSAYIDTGLIYTAKEETKPCVKTYQTQMNENPASLWASTLVKHNNGEPSDSVLGIGSLGEFVSASSQWLSFYVVFTCN